ncbi:F420-dependent NADP oxidoreductase [Martelella lutilitoris]|uniref:F420-dependent NADP oxidoreductase n=1 Tax=Martelella lutilitoris TaxID=2583532 RepID=A0A5C4JWP9_9HYPH|nr:NAD(P)-binding domain-containing protein [Martelella lutilitoris]TNB49873.1 F420-dependent NADP oxidoreductase [Martelella lutilitoris]
MTIGFIGTGEITKAVVTGMSTADGEKPTILVSPRNEEIAAGLADRFENVEIAASNQDVIDGAETVCLALRPGDAEEIVKTLKFGPSHHVISFMPTFSQARLARIVAPATRITLVTPLPAVAFHGGPTPVFPPDEDAIAMFEPLGTVVAAETDDEYQAMCVATASLAGAFAYYETIADWLQAKNLPADKARAFSGAVFYALAATARNAPDMSFSELTHESATRGGTNEQVLKHLKDNNVYTAFSKALDGIWDRFENAKPSSD